MRSDSSQASSTSTKQLDAGGILGIGLAAGGLEESTRIAIAGCFGALFASFDVKSDAFASDPDYSALCSTALFGKPGTGPTPIEWQNSLLRGIAMQIALRESPTALLGNADVRARVLEQVRTMLASTNVALALCGVRSAAYYLAAELHPDAARRPEQLDTAILNELARLIKTDSTNVEVKQHVAMAVAFTYRSFWHAFEARVVAGSTSFERIATARQSAFDGYETESTKIRISLVESMLTSGKPLAYSTAVLDPLCRALVNGCKERNTVVRTNSELALVDLAQLANDSLREVIVEHCLAKLEGIRDTVAELVNGPLKRVALQLSGNRARLASETVLEQSLFAISQEIEDLSTR